MDSLKSTLLRRVIGACNDSYLFTNGIEHVDCTKHMCGVYQVRMYEGSPGPGCSGSDVVDPHVDALVGTLTGLTNTLRCPSDDPFIDGDYKYSVFGSLAAVS